MIIRLDLGWCWGNNQTTDTSSYEDILSQSCEVGMPILFGTVASET